MASWPHASPPNALGWAASLGAVLEQYPLGLVQECCDPRTGLAREREFPPTPKSIIDWCDKRLLYHRGMVKWGQQQVAAAADDFSDDHRKSMLARLQGLFSSIWSKEPQQQAAE